jgi:hypothetical protein
VMVNALHAHDRRGRDRFRASKRQAARAASHVADSPISRGGRRRWWPRRWLASGASTP